MITKLRVNTHEDSKTLAGILSTNYRVWIEQSLPAGAYGTEIVVCVEDLTPNPS